MSVTFWLRYRTPSSSGKYMGFGLRIETGTGRTTIIVDIFDIIQQIRDTGFHLKVDAGEQMADHARPCDHELKFFTSAYYVRI